jgi:hypothetical protein
VHGGARSDDLHLRRFREEYTTRDASSIPNAPSVQGQTVDDDEELFDGFDAGIGDLRGSVSRGIDV